MSTTPTDPAPAPEALRATVARLSRMGFARPDEAAETLSGPLALWDLAANAATDAAAAAIVSSLTRTADPDQALRYLAGVAATDSGRLIVQALRGSPLLRTRLLSVLGASSALAEHLLFYPDDALVLLEDLPVSDPADPAYSVEALGAPGRRIAAAVGADPDDPVRGSQGKPAGRAGPEAEQLLRDAYRRELLRVAAADLAGDLVLAQVTVALADLAGAVLQTALAVGLARLPEPVAPFRLSVIAMGKTGGRELNYVSDVDVIFAAEPGVAPPEPGEDGPDSAAVAAGLAAATRLASEMMRICRSAAWEVDAALRPEGKDGALVRTIASHVAYYQRWASTWEFQALLKARPIAGDPTLGRQYAEAVSPFIWAAAERPDFVADVQAMRRRVVDLLSPKVADRELKLGSGGLRDVEFAVQLLQLVHGRGDERLRVGGTLTALAALRDGGYVGRDDALSLIDAYSFLRTAEHRLQLARLRRTHVVPDDAEALLRLARSMGFRPDARGDSVAVFRAEWALHAREVRRLHEKLFYRPLLEAVARVPSEALRLTPDEARRRLEALGFADAGGALRHIEALTSGLSRRASIQRALLPVILSDLADAPDPDAGLLGYRQVSDALGGTPWFLRLLRDEGAVATRLALILGTSRYAADLLLRAPESLQLLADPAQLRPHRRGELEVAMTTAARRQPDSTRAGNAIRSLRRVELLRIAFADLLDVASTVEVQIALTELADATIAAALSAVRREVGEELGLGAGESALQFSVIAMGRLGGQEIGYGSDADVLFVYRPDGAGAGAGEAAAKHARAIAEGLRAMLSAASSDPPLVLDANLRPEGRDGPLVRSLDSYAEYYARWSSVWERQALLRARAVAGNAELSEDFVQLVDDIRYPETGLSPAEVLEIRRIKGRVDSERLPRGSDPLTHTKLGRGGLADVEWTVQLLQLCYAWRVLGLRTTSTLPSLRSAAAENLITTDEAAALEAAWMLASTVRSAIVLATGKATDQLPKPGRVLTAVGRIIGYPPDFESGQLIDDYLRATRRARRVVEAVFYDAEL